MRIAKAGLACIALSMAMAGCRDARDTEPTPSQATQTAPAASETPISIIRPDIATEASPAPEPEPLEAVVPFAGGGHDLDAAAETALAGVLASPQLERGWPIVLRGHTDSAGDDRINLRVSRRRAEAVADWLVKHGVDKERITIIALGEQRPIAPNAHLDGTADEEGRARNRRVTVTIAAAPSGSEPAPGTEPEKTSSG
jgi:OOP family OmpA-OmpF porin